MSSPTRTVRGIDLSPGLTPTERVRLFFRQYDAQKIDFNRFDTDLLKNDLKLISAAPGEVVFELVVKEAHTNGLGNMHGACAALIFDICTSCALVPDAADGFWEFLGVSRSLNVTYLRPVPVGATVVVTANVVHAGRKLATVRGVIVNKEDGKICSMAEHLKVNAVPGAVL